MPRKPVRDWITTEEAAAYIGVTAARFRGYLELAIQRELLPNSAKAGKTWLHYIGDVKKLKEAREKNFVPMRRRKRAQAQIKPAAKIPFSGDESQSDTDDD